MFKIKSNNLDGSHLIFDRFVNILTHENFPLYGTIMVILDGSCRLQFWTLHINTCISFVCNFKFCPKLLATTIHYFCIHVYMYSVVVISWYYVREFFIGQLEQPNSDSDSDHSDTSSAAAPYYDEVNIITL